jgi:diguanylate cyclase (GGDEF)-like protein
MAENEKINEEICTYFDNKAPILFFLLSPQGEIIRANRYAKTLTGRSLTGDRFRDIIIDFRGDANLSSVVTDASEERLINVSSADGLPQSFYFTFIRISTFTLAFGRLDAEELESMHREILTLNHNLNNLTRELHKKNFQLEKLNTDLQNANQAILELTRKDPLTKLANRRYFNERIEEMVSLAKRKLLPLSIIMTDIDKFKDVNDKFGHNAGDQVLIGFSNLMKSSLRQEDLPARFGGEEFIIVLNSTDFRGAYKLSERIRKALSSSDLLGGRHFVTASFGISQLGHGESITDFINRADAALYQAKASGRNRTVIAGLPES